MANALYDRGRQGFLAGEIDWDANDIRIILIDEADDTIDLAVDEDLADRAGAARVATSSALGSKTTTAGVASGEAVGVVLIVGQGLPQFVTAAGIGSGEAFGVALLLLQLVASRSLRIEREGRTVSVVRESRTVVAGSESRTIVIRGG